MPEVLTFKQLPAFFQQFHIKPFYEEYIPGARVICREDSDRKNVYFQIPTPVFQKIKKDELASLKHHIHEWWQTEGIFDENFISISRISGHFLEL